MLFMQKSKGSDEKEEGGYIPREWWRDRRRENDENLSVSNKHDRQENSDDRSDCLGMIFRTSLRSNPMHGYSDQHFLKNFSVPSVKNAVCASCAIDDRYKNCRAIDWMKIIFPFVRRPFPLPLTWAKAAEKFPLRKKSILSHRILSDLFFEAFLPFFTIFFELQNFLL